MSNEPDAGRPSDTSRTLSTRRSFLRAMAVAVPGLLAAACRVRNMAAPESASPATSEVSATIAPDTPPAATGEATQAAAPTSPLTRVAIAQADSYERDIVRRKVEEMIDSLGGLADVVRPGDRVAIKVNLTSGSNFQPPPGVLAVESYVTHPEVVRAIGELVLEAGASELYIVEAVFDEESYPEWGYTDLADELGATLIDLNLPDPYDDFDIVPVGAGWYIYESFFLNHILQEIDTFISVAKMKCHYSAGVTLSMKNLIGLVPVTRYRLSRRDWWRSALHGADYGPTRLPRVIVDLNRARPIHLALIDGIKTAEGGEVPRGSFAPVEPGVLIAGKNPLATDAVATAVMGFDPTADYPRSPFLHGDNHLNLAREMGLGTNHLEEIEVVGASIDDVRFEFAPSTRQVRHDEFPVRVM